MPFPIKRVFVDTDAFIALTKNDDSNHEKVVEILQRLDTKSIEYITSNYVFSEVITVGSQKMGRRYALAFIEELKSNNSKYKIEWVDEEIEKFAIDMFKRQTSKNVSLVDCTNMVFAQYYDVDAIFSFDKIYEQNGYNMVK
jgi:predicted nucleic acid-binding protein